MSGDIARVHGLPDEPVSRWIEQLSGADQDAAQRLWEHFCRRLMNFARGRLNAATRRVYDEEDAAVSAFRSLCRGIEAQRFPGITDRDNLWALLLVIASRKIMNRNRYDAQECRDGARTISESVLEQASGARSLNGIAAVEPTPELSAEVADLSEFLLNLLSESDLKRLVLLKLEGHTNEEVSEILGITRRTVQRKLERIRRVWIESSELPPGVSEVD
ncbi:MAG: ECF-type sigma factor [Planctomycetaceae bacterium]